MRLLPPILVAAFALSASPARGANASDASFGVSYLYSLASPTGTVPYSEVKMSWDPEFRELYVVASATVRVFNSGGMETFRFGADPEIGSPLSVVALPDGDLAILSSLAEGWKLVRCNFRGEYIADIAITGAPPEFYEDPPSALAYAAGRLYLASFNGMRVLVTDLDGRTVGHRDLAAELELGAKRADNGLGGFSVDADGTMLFTVPTQFTAGLVPPDGKIQAFGIKGSAPGKFQVVAGIARDAAGFVYVTDVLKSAVIVFDRQLAFVKEFGYRGRKPSNLVAPNWIAAADGRVFVGQRAKRGVSVFRVARLGRELSELSEAPAGAAEP